MPVFEIQGPDGKTYELDAPDQNAAMAALGNIGAKQQVSESPGFFGKVDAAVRGVADGLTLGFSDEISAGLGAATGIGGTFGDYSGNLAAQRGRDQSDERTSGGVRLAGQLAGGIALPLGAARNGATLVKEGGNLAARGLRYAGEGAAYGAIAGAGSADEDRLTGAVQGGGFGAVAGAAAPAIVNGAARLAQPVVDAARNSFGPAAQQAANRVGTALRTGNLPEADVQARLAQLGPDAALVDTMGTRGQALARASANVSPDARSTMETFSNARMANQPQRVVSSLETAAGLPQGNRLTVEGLQEAANRRTAPEIGRAYDEARALGYDLPLEDFQEIIGSPMGRRAFAEASRAVQNRMAAGNEGAASNLGLLDAMKRRLDSMGQVAARAGDNDTAAQATSLARTLRQQTDAALGGPEYSNARALREQAYRTEEAYQTGADLARPRIDLDAPARARGGPRMQGPVRPEVGQGYAAEMAEAILNRRGTADSLNRLYAPMQQEAMDAALQGNAAGVRRQLETERVFGDTHRALTGNSTTARQLAEMGAVGVAGAGLGYAGGLDPTQAGVAGVAAALARKGGAAVVNKVRSGNEERVAQEIARILIARGVPTTPQSVSVALSDPRRSQEIARMLAATGGSAAGR